MEAWSTHHLAQQAAKTLGSDAAASLQSYAQVLISKGLAVVFTLGHLSRITGVSYQVLRDTVDRKRDSANYRMYAINKRSGGLRFIHSVSRDLLIVQRFINQHILQKCAPHPSCGIKKCATMHCGARWLFHFDLKDFFYDITEIDVFHIFKAMGYRNLLAFELARLCTTTCLPKGQERLLFHSTNSKYNVYRDPNGIVGVLPQGAPTSPMLSNLAAQKLDEELSSFALMHGFVYTRYADDITFSASYIPKGLNIGNIQRQIIHIIRTTGFEENNQKIHIAGPGSKKVVLGLLVDGNEPRISREMYHRIERYLYAIEKYGLRNVACHEGFISAYGFFNHLTGLIAFVKDVDQKRWEEFSSRISRIQTPWHL
jgi:RNA-directed DNA polymerase